MLCYVGGTCCSNASRRPRVRCGTWTSRRTRSRSFRRRRRISRRFVLNLLKRGRVAICWNSSLIPGLQERLWDVRDCREDAYQVIHGSANKSCIGARACVMRSNLFASAKIRVSRRSCSSLCAKTWRRLVSVASSTCASTWIVCETTTARPWNCPSCEVQPLLVTGSLNNSWFQPMRPHLHIFSVSCVSRSASSAVAFINSVGNFIFYLYYDQFIFLSCPKYVLRGCECFLCFTSTLMIVHVLLRNKPVFWFLVQKTHNILSVSKFLCQLVP